MVFDPRVARASVFLYVLIFARSVVKTLVFVFPNALNTSQGNITVIRHALLDVYKQTNTDFYKTNKHTTRKGT